MPWIAVAALVSVWAFEINLLQARTLISESGWKAADYAAAVSFRTTINALFCTALVLLLPRLLQAVGFVVLLLFVQGASFYQHYFGKALSWTTLRTQFGEGAESVVLDKAFILPGVLTVSLLLLAVKLALLWGQRKYPLRWRIRLPLGLLAAVLYVGLIIAFNAHGNTRLKSLRNWMSFDRVGVAHGYVVTWVGEAIHINNANLLEKALLAREIRDNRITPIEGPLGLPGHVVFLQVESLDWHVLGLEREGVEITPTLNALRDESMLFQVEAIHKNGSADADFVMLHGCMVAPGVINYKIAGFPHDDTLPGLAHDAGYPMTFFHGNKGRFYNRRDAFEQMGFEQIVFSEDMVDRYGLEPKKWSAIPDRDVLMLSARMLNAAESPQSHMIVTYTSHTPFVMLPDEEPRLLDNPGDEVGTRYLNSIHYVDQAIRDYLDVLPEGTTVVIYSDHESAAGYPERRRVSGEPELIPVLVWRKGGDLAARQRSAVLPEARNGTWSLIDVATWARAWLETPQDPPEAPGAPTLPDG